MFVYQQGQEDRTLKTFSGNWGAAARGGRGEGGGGGGGGGGESVNPFRSAGLTVLQPLVGRENSIYQNHSMGLVGTAFST